MSKEVISKEYREIDGQTLRIELYYNIGGYSYATGRTLERGYYASVLPVELSTTSEGYTMEKYSAYTGVYRLIHPVKRKSKSAELKAEKMFDETVQQELINYVLGREAA